MLKILLVEDEGIIAADMESMLEKMGYEVLETAMDYEEAIERLEEETPDLILLDVMLPGLSGVEVCKLIREKSMVPIVMLSARSDKQDVVEGLEAGADDYMVKPFDPSELVARMKVRLRRTTADISTDLKIGNIKIDQIEHSIIRDGEVIALTRLEFDLLVALAKEPGRVFSREALLSEVWGYRPATDTRLVNVHIQRLRAKVEVDSENPSIILTVRGVGYKAGVAGSSQ